MTAGTEGLEEGGGETSGAPLALPSALLLGGRGDNEYQSATMMEGMELGVLAVQR